MTFQIHTPDSADWRLAYELIPDERRDIFYSPSFASLCQKTINKNDEVLCALSYADSEIIIYPFAKRNIGKLVNIDTYNAHYDLIGLYGRGGMVSTGVPKTKAISDFYSHLKTYCDENSIICSFDRYHPVIANDHLSPLNTEVFDVGGFVVVDLRPKMSEIEANFKSSVRKDIKKAQRNGIQCFFESGSSSLQIFLEIYYDTMSRNGATDFYYFDESFFKALDEDLKGNFIYFYAKFESKIVSCELVLFEGRYCHSFLGGTLKEALPLSANPMLKYEIIRQCKSFGCEYFLLGGGTHPNDGIYNFKKAYSPCGIYRSKIGGTLWNKIQFDKLRQVMIDNNRSISVSRFMFYDV